MRGKADIRSVELQPFAAKRLTVMTGERERGPQFPDSGRLAIILPARRVPDPRDGDNLLVERDLGFGSFRIGVAAGPLSASLNTVAAAGGEDA